MDNKTANETASKLYSATAIILEILDSRTISQDDVRKILSMPGGKLSIASAAISGADRATKLAAVMQENLFPPLPAEATITGAILAINGSGDMTTEEYLSINDRLLGNLPDDTLTIVTLSADENVKDSLKGTLFFLWGTGL